MSVARGFFDGKSVYTNIVKKQIDINLNFIVDSTNGNGLGLRSLKSNGFVESVFMNTSSTPGVINGYTNPNPIAGYALVRFKNNFNYYLGGFSGFAAAATSTSTTSTTIHDPYLITSLGTASLAQWQAAGLPQGFTPAVGQAFIAKATGAIGGSATVGVPAASQIVSVSIVGDPNATIANASIAANAGASILIQFNAATSASVPTLIATAPADGTVVGMMFRFDGSSVSVDGI